MMTVTVFDRRTEESTLEMDSSVPLMHHDPRDLGLICVIKKHKIRFRILSDLRIQSWIFFKETHPQIVQDAIDSSGMVVPQVLTPALLTSEQYSNKHRE